MGKKKDLLKQIKWLDKRKQYDIDFFELLLPQRVVSDNPRYNNGTFYSQKCGREIQYESGKELAFIEFLEQSDKVIFYFEQPVKIHFRLGCGRKLSYTPDFGVLLDTKEFFIVEIKELSGMLENKVQKKIEGLLEFCFQRGFGLLLTDGKDTIEKIKKAKVNKALEKEILQTLNNGLLRKSTCNKLLKSHNASQLELYKIIIKNNLKYTAYPFRLLRGNKNHKFRHIFIDNKKYTDLLLNAFLK